MFQSSSITNLNDLQTWFNSLDKHGYWVVYRGPEKKPESAQHPVVMNL
ncbi:MAG: hypothetical protein IPP06_04060 [Saprospiraceae bacterium]|nr:hypothetical protein [Candidatus Vicinibacter affinis]